MNILAIETSGSLGSVALQQGKERTQLNIEVKQQQIAPILSLIDELLTQSKLTLHDLDYLAFSAGPGSFTGIRIALGIVQGIALATNKPVIAISSLQCLAQTSWRLLQQKCVVPCINAYMDQVYWGCYELDEQGVMRAMQPDQVSAPEAVGVPGEAKDDAQLNFQQVPFDAKQQRCRSGRTLSGTGNAWQVYADRIPQDVQKQLIQTDFAITPQAHDLLILAAALCHEAKPIDEISPFYLREQDAWRKIPSK